MIAFLEKREGFRELFRGIFGSTNTITVTHIVQFSVPPKKKKHFSCNFIVHCGFFDFEVFISTSSFIFASLLISTQSPKEKKPPLVDPPFHLSTFFPHFLKIGSRSTVFASLLPNGRDGSIIAAFAFTSEPAAARRHRCWRRDADPLILLSDGVSAAQE